MVYIYNMSKILLSLHLLVQPVHQLHKIPLTLFPIPVNISVIQSYHIRTATTLLHRSLQYTLPAAVSFPMQSTRLGAIHRPKQHIKIYFGM